MCSCFFHEMFFAIMIIYEVADPIIAVALAMLHTANVEGII